ncbi:hypothetical protein CO610_01350 [Lysobacteraceae bacterium NML95-0200]|nr:hypothetical protein CO610_01350 [Xanthomonadaceae bacterium NML95-0200]
MGWLRKLLKEIYFLTSPESPGVFDLIISLVRALLLILLFLFFSYIFIDIKYVEEYWYLYSFVILGVEDMERINFSRRSAYPWVSALFFASGISIFELAVNFSRMADVGGVFEYLLVRIPPTIMHFVFASIAALLVRKKFFWSLLAITPLHVFF